ncbi:SMI1/KNR4 family protein [Herpetosiphon sp. NSE202]|uniref:SMI1/KNR4 family protein n=1 Tax=Herpetosiphon sp. NSE202 TaxID=3351349 RepID=UPI003632BEBA
MYISYMQKLASFVVEAGLVETVAGVDETAINELEQQRGYQLPACYRAFLATFGKTNTRRWFDGDDAALDRLDDAFSVATYMLNDGPIPWLADPFIVPFTQHQAYVLYYFWRNQGDDPAFFCTVLGDEPPPTEPSQLAPAFSIWLRERTFASINPHNWYHTAHISMIIPLELLKNAITCSRNI